MNIQDGGKYGKQPNILVCMTLIVVFVIKGVPPPRTHKYAHTLISGNFEVVTSYGKGTLQMSLRLWTFR